MTGYTVEQLDALVTLIGGEETTASGGRLPSVGLADSVVLLLSCWHHNLTQKVAAAIFDTSRPTVSRRCEALKPVIERALARFVPDPVEVTRGDTVLLDGTLVACSDWADQDDLFSGKQHTTGLNVQVAATVEGRLLAVGTPVHGARHDAHCWHASGLADSMAGMHILADLGYVGVDGLETGIRRKPGQRLTDRERTLNRSLSAVRSAIERAIAHLKNWKTLKTRYRGPLDRFPSLLRTIAALHFYQAATTVTSDF